MKNKLITIDNNKAYNLDVDECLKTIEETNKTTGGYLNDGVNANPVKTIVFTVAISI